MPVKKSRVIQDHTPIPSFVDEKTVSRMTGTALPTLRKWRHERRGPSYIKIGRMVRYSVDDVRKFMEAHRVILQHYSA